MLAKPSNQLAPPLRRARFRPSERQRANACIHLVLGDVETHDNAIILCHHPAPFLARSGLEAPATVRVEEDTGSVPRSPSGSQGPLSTNGLRSSERAVGKNRPFAHSARFGRHKITEETVKTIACGNAGLIR